MTAKELFMVYPRPCEYTLQILYVTDSQNAFEAAAKVHVSHGSNLSCKTEHLSLKRLRRSHAPHEPLDSGGINYNHLKHLSLQPQQSNKYRWAQTGKMAVHGG